MAALRSRLWCWLTRKQFSWLSVTGAIVAVSFAEHYLWQTCAVLGGLYAVVYSRDGLRGLRRVLRHGKKA